ncbi:HD-GYP domain-containing protein [Actinospongicola halichondriae]|uniref:HD-GYP domain-containing protein n=1 Tax=Actinospongicola halichondriae TaxID=3236844 RepID=UPI003D40B26A
MPLKQENRWAAHPRRALAVKAAVYLVPAIACGTSSVYAGRWIQHSFPSMPWYGPTLLSLPISVVVLIVVQRLMRRLLPLSMLLKLSLLFPDQVPNRLGLALRSASPKRLARRAQSDDPGESSVAAKVLTLAATLNAHDRRTRGHSERVRAVTMLLADELDLAGAERDRLEWASLLHDLGKIEVPAEILNKAGRPSADEWNILKAHPAAGPALAGSLRPWLGDWIHAMDQHHERFDGTGYPAGLAGDEIATSGRIVAVADAFEVMTAARSYKQPMSTEAAREELVSCSGTHFDPTVVRSFMRVSVSDLHRALGPTSWLLSLPFSRQVGRTMQLGGAITGGSVPPALVGAMALTLLATPGAAVTAGTRTAGEVAVADVGDVLDDADPTSIDEPGHHRTSAKSDPADESTATEPGGPGTDPEPDDESSPGTDLADDDPGHQAPTTGSTTTVPGSPPTTSAPSVPPGPGPTTIPTTSTPPTTSPPTTAPPTTTTSPGGTPGKTLGEILSETIDTVTEIVEGTTGSVGGILPGLSPFSSDEEETTPLL